MAKSDRFGGAEAWDRYCDEIERRREYASKNLCCWQCDNSRAPDGENRDMIGWCVTAKDFINLDAHPIDYDCEEFDICF